MTSEEEVVIRDLLLKNRFSGGSGRGFSFFYNAAKCGMREHLYARHAARP